MIICIDDTIWRDVIDLLRDIGLTVIELPSSLRYKKPQFVIDEIEHFIIENNCTVFLTRRKAFLSLSKTIPAYVKVVVDFDSICEALRRIGIECEEFINHKTSCIDVHDINNVIIFVEAQRSVCRTLRAYINAKVIECCMGKKWSKTVAYEKYGIPDDDFLCAIEFLKTCREHDATQCIAFIRDNNVKSWIEYLLNTQFDDIKNRVVVIKMPFIQNPQYYVKFITKKLTCHGK